MGAQIVYDDKKVRILAIIAMLFALSKSAIADSPSVTAVVRDDGGVAVTVSATAAYCPTCSPDSHDCGSVHLYYEQSITPNCSGFAISRGGLASCTYVYDRKQLHGTHTFKGNASDCSGNYITYFDLTIDNTPNINMLQPDNKVYGPFDILSQASFKPSLSAVKGTVDINYLNTGYNTWVPLASKQCSTELCDISYKNIKGHLFDISHGMHYFKVDASSGNGARTDTGIYSVFVDKTPSVSFTEMAEVLPKHFNVKGTAMFKPTLQDVKGVLTLYSHNSSYNLWVSVAQKTCYYENCDFDYFDIKGNLYERSAGGPYKIRLEASGGGALTNVEHHFYVCDASYDKDGDGYFAKVPGCPAGNDCNDNDSSIHPVAIALCDNIDNNCNGQIDEAMFQDKDSDGYPVQFGGCPTLGVYDCNDNDAKIYPNAPEICNDLKDNNCNGVTDESCKRDRCAEVPM